MLWPVSLVLSPIFHIHSLMVFYVVINKNMAVVSYCCHGNAGSQQQHRLQLLRMDTKRRNFYFIFLKGSIPGRISFVFPTCSIVKRQSFNLLLHQALHTVFETLLISGLQLKLHQKTCSHPWMLAVYIDVVPLWVLGRFLSDGNQAGAERLCENSPVTGASGEKPLSHAHTGQTCKLHTQRKTQLGLEHCKNWILRKKTDLCVKKMFLIFSFTITYGSLWTYTEIKHVHIIFNLC